MAITTFGDVSWERMTNAVENVRRRLLRVARALGDARVPYAVAGGNAVAAWVSRVDEAAVRNTRAVDIVLRRSDLPSARTALERAGFVYRHAAGMDMFLDGPTGRARDAVHILFAAEKVRPDYTLPAPDVLESEQTETFCLLSLDALVRMKLTSFRDRDRVHLRDLIDVGLVDESWLHLVPESLRVRLEEVIDHPEAESSRPFDQTDAVGRGGRRRTNKNPPLRTSGEVRELRAATSSGGLSRSCRR